MSKISDVMAAIWGGSETHGVAMDAISTTLAISGWTLTVIAIVLGAIAVFGFSAIKDGARSMAKKTIDDYIQSEEFAKLVNKRIDALDAERRASLGLTEGRDDDADPFARAEE